MADNDDESASGYLAQLLQRTQSLREGRGFSQAQMAKYLGLKLETYKKYEQRSPLPHRLISDFCELTGVTETFFLTGRQGSRRSPKKTA